ncbi:putative phospholipase B-like 2 [Symbiodinium microadriaticum]|uniref:Putative phospholipase B-like 2 n=1 Tax=Symbiodinium microadriaticum TaxID=2951 RepID=A0A1Q9CQ86_SYMMI|nr:putative phospholipase B-like 2 [Symbiodinium microadriaticum]
MKCLARYLVLSSIVCYGLAIKARGVHPNLTPLFNVKATFDRKNIDKLKGLSATLDNETNQIVLVNAVEDQAVSWARLADRLSETGWMELHVSTPKGAFFSNDLKMYSAGIVEGYLTAERMSQFYSNFYPLLQPNEDSTLAMMNIRNSFNQQIQHIMRMCHLAAGTAEGEPADPYWKHVRYLFLQMWGLKDAYNLVAGEKGVRTIDMVDLLFINSHAELPELIEAFRPQAVAERSGAASSDDAPDVQNFSAGSLLEAHVSQADALTIDSDWKLRLAKHGHCTALVRLAPANSDLFIGHTTWGDYSKMSRVYKYYRFDLPLSFQSHEMMGFSSYPGCVSSTDDFYMMDNGLAVMDTTLEVLNQKLYSRVMDDPDRPRLPKFLHVMAVNRVAKTGTQWTSMMAEENTGTGNSQWIVVDYNRFTPGQPLQQNTLRILEQVPGMTHQADITTELTSRGYWGAFNRPFFEDIRRMSGHKIAEESYGKLFSFEDSPRASLLRRFGSGVSQLGDMRSTMTRNDPKDAVPGFPAGPGHAIMARLDLDAMANNIPNGGIDAKVTSACLFKRMACQAMSGPSHGSYPAFRWTRKATDAAPSAEMFQGWPHLGLPDVWDFDFVEMSSDEDKLANSQLSDSDWGSWWSGRGAPRVSQAWHEEKVHVRQQNSGGLISLTFLISPVYNKARLFAIRCRLSGRAAVRDVLQAALKDSIPWLTSRVKNSQTLCGPLHLQGDFDQTARSTAQDQRLLAVDLPLINEGRLPLEAFVEVDGCQVWSSTRLQLHSQPTLEATWDEAILGSSSLQLTSNFGRARAVTAVVGAAAACGHGFGCLIGGLLREAARHLGEAVKSPSIHGPRPCRKTGRVQGITAAMSKLNIDNLKKGIAGILEGSKEKQRKFLVELQIGLKDYDTQRDKRFAGTIKLPHVPRPRLKVCVLGDAVHCEQAQRANIPFKSVEDLKKLNKNKKMVKLADSFDAFLVLIPQIPRLLGPGLNKAGKFPTLVQHSDNLETKVTEVRSQVKFQLKKVLCMGVAVGNVAMTPDELRQNCLMAINFLVSLLKKNWNNALLFGPAAMDAAGTGVQSQIGGNQFDVSLQDMVRCLRASDATIFWQKITTTGKSSPQCPTRDRFQTVTEGLLQNIKGLGKVEQRLTRIVGHTAFGMRGWLLKILQQPINGEGKLLTDNKVEIESQRREHPYERPSRKGDLKVFIKGKWLAGDKNVVGCNR